MSDDFSLFDLFGAEVEAQASPLTQGLMQLEKGDLSAANLEALMRAAHSLKGAARMIGVKPAERMAHAMEECFVAAQQGRLQLGPAHVDVLLRALDWIQRLSGQPEPELSRWYQVHDGELTEILEAIQAIVRGEEPYFMSSELAALDKEGARPAEVASPAAVAPAPLAVAGGGRSLKLASERLDSLVGLSGEVQVALGWLDQFRSSMLGLKRDLFELSDQLQVAQLVDSLGAGPAALSERLNEALSQQLHDLQSYERQMSLLSSRLHQEVVAARMCPFADRLGGFPRLVRDLSRELGKEAELTLEGQATLVDRDILERMEGPLNHLVRNALDHGLESPEQRQAGGKEKAGRIRLAASHRAGMLLLEVSDDGRGLNLEDLRQTLLGRGLVTAEMAPQLTEAELKEFLFLPKFTTREEVTEVSGRGVGLDVVRTVVQELSGRVEVHTQPGRGMRFEIWLPLTLSVTRNLLLQIAGEVYALPLSRVERLLKFRREQLREFEGKPTFDYEGRDLPVVAAHQVLGLAGGISMDGELSVLVVGPEKQRYGLVVESFLGEENLVLQVLEQRLGKLWNISAGAILKDGTPVLVLNVDDLLCSIERLLSSGNYANVKHPDAAVNPRARRILVVDDSITVREIERKLLMNQGFEVDVAVDGLDGWNAIRSRHYDLVVTDVDMPRMDGIRLVSLVKKDPDLHHLPMMIVSYKDRDEDRMRGLEAGADYYLTKGSFSDDSFIQAVRDLLGSEEP